MRLIPTRRTVSDAGSGGNYPSGLPASTVGRSAGVTSADREKEPRIVIAPHEQR